MEVKKKQYLQSGGVFSDFKPEGLFNGSEMETVSLNNER